MATKVLSIEIVQGLTHVVEMDYKVKNPKIYNCFTFVTPEGVSNDGIVRRNEQFTTIINREFEKRDIKTKKAVFVVSSSRIASRDATLPYVKEKMLPQLVEANATDYFPVDMSAFHVAYKVLEKINTKEEKNYRVNLLAVPNDLTNSYYDFASSIGLELVALDYVGNSIYQVVGKAVGNEGTKVIVKVETESSLITVIKDGVIDLQRTINYGISETINAVKENVIFGDNLTYLDAISILSKKSVLCSYLNSDDSSSNDSAELSSAKKEVTETLRYFIGNVSRVLEFYLSKNTDAKFDEISLTGLGADVSGLQKLMSNELNLKVTVFHDVEKVGFSKTVAEENLHINAYAACLGAALNPVNLLPEQTKKTSSGKALNDTNGMYLGIAFGLLSLVVAIGLVVISSLQLSSVNKDIDKTNKHIDQLREVGVETVYNEYVKVSQLNEHLNKVYDSTMTRSEDLVEFIEELEQKLPSNLVVLSFTATDSGVSLSIECDSKESAAETLVQLRTFNSVQVVSSASLTDSGNLDNQKNPTVTMAVECVYKPVDTTKEGK